MSMGVYIFTLCPKVGPDSCRDLNATVNWQSRNAPVHGSTPLHCTGYELCWATLTIVPEEGPERRLELTRSPQEVTKVGVGYTTVEELALGLSTLSKMVPEGHPPPLI
jgi:hypothetical protein